MPLKDIDELQDYEVQQELENLQPYVDVTGPKEDIIRQLEGCPVCGSRMHFTYFSDMVHLYTHEVANCVECGYRVRKAHNFLQ